MFNDNTNSYGGGEDSNVIGSYKNSGFSSPYLNFDPAYVPAAQPEFIYIGDVNKKQRGSFELAFGQIGSSIMAGAVYGGALGFYNGLKATTLAGQTGKLRRTQLLNHIMKRGSTTANTLGLIGVIYSGTGILIAWLRETEGDVNTIASGTITGLLYKSTAGLRMCAIGGGVGLGLSLAYVAWQNMDRLGSMRSQYSRS